MSLDQTLRELKEAYDGLVISNLALKKMVKKSEGLQGKLDVAIEALDWITKQSMSMHLNTNSMQKAMRDTALDALTDIRNEDQHQGDSESEK